MSQTSTKATYGPSLPCKTPNQWASLIKKRIEGEQLRAWVASIIIHNYPKEAATEKEVWTSDLVEISDAYRSDFNSNGSVELKAALKSIGLPYFRAKNDDSPQARRAKNRESHTCLATKPGERHREAYKYTKYHREENEREAER
jgi:hypothetical protein